MEVVTRAGKLPGISITDDRLAQNAEVVGISLQGESCAYPLALLKSVGVIQDRLAGVELRLEYDSGAQRVDMWQAGQSIPAERLPFSRTRWNAWSEFHPATRIYESEDRPEVPVHSEI